MNKRILFVDDEPMVLQGLQRSLHGMRSEWDMAFASSAPEALETMARSPFDVVITDMRMPGMDGAHLLDQVKKRFPQTVRIVLSGQSDRETILRSLGPTHQFLAKPCDVDDLKQKLAHAFALRELLADPRLKEVICRLATIPSLPTLYVAITKALESPDASITEVGNIIAQDMGMCIKVLQLVNSAFFGLPGQISNPRQAAALIGIDNIKALVLSVHVFSQFENSCSQNLAFLWKHGLATAISAKAIARLEGASRRTVDECFTAGLLHDVGKLILCSVYKEESIRIWKQAADEKVSSLTLERVVLGCTHAAVGAYVLGLWGLPDPIVEAVAWHHQPAEAAPKDFSALITVHAANYYDHQRHSYPGAGEQPTLDEALLAHIGLADRHAIWQLTVQDIDTNSEKL
jgi:HD-like signal output (HDOD) protein/ActR/RegA family two-component response regulator